MELSFRELQAILIAHGFDLPKFGADGHWGGETAEAMRRWAGSAQALDLSPQPSPTLPATKTTIPADWMRPAKMRRVITHWTAGAHKASDVDRRHYHILIEGDGTLVRGTHSIRQNEKAGGAYAAHTLNANTGSIGVAVCASAGARERPYDPGRYPVTPEQWDVLVAVTAELRRAYAIPVTRETVLSHCEVPPNLGIAQRQKWDIAQVPWLVETWTALGDKFRAAVSGSI